MVDQQRSAAAGLRSRARLVVQGVLSLVLVFVIFRYLLGGIDLTEVWAEIAAMTPLELAGLLAIMAWNLATYALVPVTAGLSFRCVMMVSQAATAVANTVPTVGPAIGTGLTHRMLGSAGHSRSRATTAMLVSEVWNSLVKLSLPVLALARPPGQRLPTADQCRAGEHRRAGRHHHGLRLAAAQSAAGPTGSGW
jgi:hypothetical protein